LTLAAAGTKGTVQLWDLSANGNTRRTFGSKLKAAGRSVKEKEGAGIINVQEADDDDDGSGWEDEE
jgi:periodic tryptophan protein 1